MKTKLIIFWLLIILNLGITAFFVYAAIALHWEFIFIYASFALGLCVVCFFHGINTIQTSEYRIVKHTKICSTIEGETKFILERKYNDNVFGIESWEWQLSRNNQLEVQVILDNLKAGMELSCSIKKEIL